MRHRRGEYVQQKRSADLSALGGRATKSPLGYEAFVPAPVRDIELSVSGATAADLADGETALGRLREHSQHTSGLESLSRSLMRSEAVASSWIEALRVSHRKLAEAEQDAPGGKYDEARPVLGNIRAMATAIEVGSKSEPFSVDDIRSMHGMLMSTSNVRDDQDRAGEFRAEPVFIGGSTPATAEYVGPPNERIDELMEDLVAFVNDRQDLASTAVAAIAHAQFESILPFHDGNGRVGRCLIHTVLRRGGAGPAQPPVSIALHHVGGRYVDGLNAFRNDDLDAWLSLFATAVTFACEATVGLSTRAAALRAEWGQRLRDRRAAAGLRAPRSGSAVLASLDAITDMPAFHTRDLAERLGVTWRAAQDAVVELLDTGVIKQVSAGKGNRLYETPEVFSLLDAFELDPTAFRHAAQV